MVASNERRELARSIVRRMQRANLAKAFDKFAFATQVCEHAGVTRCCFFLRGVEFGCLTSFFAYAEQRRRQQTSMLDSFADKTMSRFSRYWEKKCFFVLWQ